MIVPTYKEYCILCICICCILVVIPSLIFGFAGRENELREHIQKYICGWVSPDAVDSDSSRRNTLASNVSQYE